MGFRAYSLGSSPTLEIIDRTHFQVLSRNLRPEWLQLARALSKNTPRGVLGVHDADETLPGSTKKRVRGFRNERFCYIVCSFVRRSHWQVRRGRLSLAPDSCPENRRSNGEQSCHGESHDPSGRHAT